MTVTLSAAADGTKFPPDVVFAATHLDRLNIVKPDIEVNYGCTKSSWVNHQYHVGFPEEVI